MHRPILPNYKNRGNRKMKIKELINILKRVPDKDRGDIYFYYGEKTLDIKEISGYGLSADINIRLHEVKIPLISPCNFKRKHDKKIQKIANKIRKGE